MTDRKIFVQDDDIHSQMVGKFLEVVRLIIVQITFFRYVRTCSDIERYIRK